MKATVLLKCDSDNKNMIILSRGFSMLYKYYAVWNILSPK